MALPFISSLNVPDLDAGTAAVVAAFLLGFAVVPLALAAWIDPGSRAAGVGITLMTASLLAGGSVLTMAVLLQDPAMARFLPPEGPGPLADMTWFRGLIVSLLLGGAGWLLWRRSEAARAAQARE